MQVNGIMGIAVCGVAGVLARYLADQAGLRLWPGAFPLATFVVNVVGCFLAGALMSITTEFRVPLMVGFLGGFTTFSAYAFQSLSLVQNGQTGLAIAYWIGSPVAGVLAAFAGQYLVLQFRV